MIIIGVTGGVGAGKSEILHYLETNYNCRVLLADEAARALEAPGGAIYDRLIRLLEEYPEYPAGTDSEEGFELPSVILPDGRINNPEMARRLFSSQELREKVNELVHPAVKTYLFDMAAQEKEAGKLDLFIVEAALLIEAGYRDELDVLWYIYCDEAERRRRLRASRGYSDEKIDNILKSQLSEKQFREASDLVIDNSGRIEDACAQVDAALAKYGIRKRSSEN